MGVTGGRDRSASRPRRNRPALRRRRRLLGVIFVGGALGASARSALEQLAPVADHAVPWITLAINVIGSFVLGLLLELLARTGHDAGWRRVVRLGLGTGVLGGFTTYSTFAVETVQRLTLQEHVVGLAYAVVSVALGVGAAATGFRLAHGLRPRRAGQVGR
ncbi:CrcB family protein [Intrasporangium sp.]|uniref:fluoride efflux transporter FluC n=1 Tax=Intrasporangium sp. TaxID=1925024 RepID=UPI0032215E3C